MKAMASLDKSVIPAGLKGDAFLTSEKGSRAFLEDKYERASDEDQQDKEDAKQGPLERAYFLQKNAEKKQLVRNSRKPLVKDKCLIQFCFG